MKDYLIIGGSSGIGKVLAQTLKERSHRIFATYNKNPGQHEEPNLSYHFLDV